jgi:hypothetical protein
VCLPVAIHAKHDEIVFLRLTAVFNLDDMMNDDIFLTANITTMQRITKKLGLKPVGDISSILCRLGRQS